MALSGRSVLEVRPTGSATNAGLFDPSVASPGNDYSQQDTAQTTRTDMVIGASNTVTSAAFPFQSVEAGNGLRISTNTGGWTAGLYLIQSISGVTATLDRSPGTLASSSGAGKMGGANASIVDLPTLPDGSTIWLRAGAGYTTAVQWAPNGASTDGRFITIQGYGTTRGDNGLATITASSNLVPVLSIAAQTILKNLKLDGANTADRGIDFAIDCYFENVWVTRCNLSGVRAQNEGTRGRRSLFTFCGAGAAAGTGMDLGTGCIAEACEAHDCKQGFSSSNSSGEFLSCVSHGNTANGFYQAGDDGMRLRNCIADSNTLDGLRINDTGGGTTLEVTNCFFTNNGGKGVNSVTTDYSAAVSASMAAFFQNNAFYNNTGGNYGQVPQGATDVILTASPYTNAAGGDYSLNGTTGGGAAALGAGIPGGVGLLGAAALTSVGHTDIGAFQSLGAAPATSALVSMRSLWREITGERFVQVTDAIIDIYLTWALHELNRRVHYHVSDGTITLVAGTQEYALPSDFVEAQWLSFGAFRKLERSDVERWMSRSEDWRHESPSEPTSFAIYANKLILRPAPSNEAVVASSTVTLRYVSTPPDITGAGPEQLGSQDYRTVVVWAAFLWSVAYPDSAVATQRAQALKAEFEDQVGLIRVDYAKRSISS